VVVIAAITSCTNTSNPQVMPRRRPCWQEGRRGRPAAEAVRQDGWRRIAVVTASRKAWLTPYLERCASTRLATAATTCIGNSGDLPAPVAAAVRSTDILAAAVLSGNRQTSRGESTRSRARTTWLRRPLVVAYALAGTVDIDLATEPIGQNPSGQDVYLRDIWPSDAEIAQTIEERGRAGDVPSPLCRRLQGDDGGRPLPIPESDLFVFEDSSTYVQEPPYFATWLRSRADRRTSPVRGCW